MWFKQLSIYLFNKDKLPEYDQLASDLEKAKFTPCLGLDWYSEGFNQPVSFSDDLVFLAQNTLNISLKKQEKVLPAGVIKEFLDERLLEIENSENRKVGKKEKKELKEIVTDNLLPKAFTRNQSTHSIIDYDNGFIFINSSSSNKSENLLTKLREALSGLEVKLPKTNNSATSVMTNWLQAGHAEGGFEFDCDCELKGVGDIVPTIKISKQNLNEEEVTQHIKKGKVVTQLGLVWEDKMSFVLTQDFTFKRIKFLDTIQDEVELNGDDVESLTFASQIIMSDTFSKMISELVSYMGGWQD